MHNSDEMRKLTTKLGDLKELFKIGEKIIPGIQKLIDFMAEIMPMLHKINDSIEESNSKIPKASDHLSDVTSATEIATTEILDKIDETENELNKSEIALGELVEAGTEKSDIISELKNVVKDNSQAIELIEKYEKINHGIESIEKVKSSVQNIQNNIQNITITLQVQDITSQQLSAVNHLIGSVQKRLTELIMDFSDEDIKLNDFQKETEEEQTKHFDPDASYVRKDEAQDLADSLIKSQNDVTTQEDIDKLFNANGNK